MEFLLAVLLLSTNPVHQPTEDHVAAIEHNRCWWQQVIFWREYSPGELHVGDWRHETSIVAWEVDYIGDRYRCRFFDESTGTFRVVWCRAILRSVTDYDPERQDACTWKGDRVGLAPRRQ